MTIIGITGGSGFIGQHLQKTLGLLKVFNIITINKKDYESNQKLEEFVSGCNVIVHLASLNRNESDEYLFKKILK